jgi:hypothetical protein
MTRPRDGGRTEREREGVEKKSGAKREEEEKFQIVVWRERLRNVGLVA